MRGLKRFRELFKTRKPRAVYCSGGEELLISRSINEANNDGNGFSFQSGPIRPDRPQFDGRHVNRARGIGGNVKRNQAGTSALFSLSLSLALSLKRLGISGLLFSPPCFGLFFLVYSLFEMRGPRPCGKLRTALEEKAGRISISGMSWRVCCCACQRSRVKVGRSPSLFFFVSSCFLFSIVRSCGCPCVEGPFSDLSEIPGVSTTKGEPFPRKGTRKAKSARYVKGETCEIRRTCE